MDLILLYTTRPKPKRETEQHNPVTTFHTQPINTFVYLRPWRFTSVARRLTSSKIRWEVPPKACSAAHTRQATAPASLRFHTLKPSSIFGKTGYRNSPGNSQGDNWFQRKVCSFKTRLGNPEQPQLSQLSDESWEHSRSHHKQHSFLKSDPKPLILP